MLKNYLKIAFRNLRKQGAFAVINILGLAIGMACCFLIVQYIGHETSYDKFHKNLDRLYRIAYHISFTDEITLARIPPAFISQISEHFPEIEVAARMYPRDISVEVLETEKQFEIEGSYFADSSITQIFTFDFLYGDASTALEQPFSVILTDKMAKTFFGNTHPIGKQLRLGEANNFEVTGVIRDWPDNAHTRLNMIMPYKNMVDLEPEHARATMRQVLQSNWMASHSYTYILLKENQNIQSVNDKFPAYIQKYGHENIRDKQAFSLFPVKDIHLRSTMGLEQRTPIDINRLYLFAGIGIITLLIACINFINLTTASSLNRAKEVGVRKVMGAGKGSLVGQFLGESLLLSFFAFLLSLALAALALPVLNRLTQLDLVFKPWNPPFILLTFVGIFILSGLLAGSYPAFYVSKFQAVASLKGNSGSTQKAGGIALRKVLIILQFLASITFISGAIIIFLQLNYLRNQPLGFARDLILRVPIDSGNNLNAAFRAGDPTIRQRMNTLDALLLSNPNIKAVTQCNRVPGFGAIGRPVWNDHVTQEDAFTVGVNSVDYDYIETFNLEIVAGRNFDLSYGTDHINSFLINESAVTALGWESPKAAIGQHLVERQEGKIVGVLKDFHFENARREIQPLVLRVQPGDFSTFVVRLKNANISRTLAFIENKWREFFPGKVFEYEFLDQALNDRYSGDERFSNMIASFALLAILISCFGLFGLAALVTQQRFKEIGIRKVLGASVFQILNILATDFLKLIVIAMILAIPLTWYFANDWLEDFAFRIDFPWWVTLATGLGVILIAFLTISSQAIRTAMSNPVEALQYE